MSAVGIVCRLNSANVGDSAMYDNLVAHLPAGWTPIPIVDSTGAAEACIRNGYPGATTEADADFAGLDAILVGGGDFDAGGIVDRFPLAVPLLGIGLSLGPHTSDRMLNLLSLARAVYVRDCDSLDFFPSAIPTCDLAWDLPVAEPCPPLGRVLLTLRAPFEMPVEPEWRKSAGCLHRIITDLNRLGFAWSVLPFNVDDERWSLEAGIARDRVLPSRWFRPGEAATVKGYIAGADLVVSIGRLHAAVFAASQHVPVLAFVPRPLPKMRGLFHELGVRSYCRAAEDYIRGDIDPFLAHLDIARRDLTARDPKQSATLHWRALAEFLS